MPLALLIDLGFPLGIRLTHAFNFVFLTLLIRSGIEILGGHPMLYFNDDCRPGSEWIRLTNKRMFRNRRWTAEDEKQPYTPWVALPGRDNLGLGRFWHFTAAVGWLVTGLMYLLALTANQQWQRLVPTSWAVFPEAWQAVLAYLRLDVPPAGNPYNALQQLTYFAVVLMLAPLQIFTGLLMSPALSGRFAWLPRLIGGRQAARSLHFIGLIAFTAFTVHHVALVIAHGLLDGLAAIVLGVEVATAAQRAVAAAISIAFLVAVIALHVWATRRSLIAPRAVQNALQRFIDPLQARLLQPLTSLQRYHPEDITPNPRPNGRPPQNEAYLNLVESGFDNWRFEVGGLVEQPLAFTLDELRALPPEHQITQHKCIQGWSYVAAWQGVPLKVLLDRCRATPQARYILFRTFDKKWEKPGHGEYYSAIDLDLARAPQTLLAYGMNGKPLPTAFGAPLRLRLESQLGYKMVNGSGQWNWSPATTTSAPGMEAGVLISCITAVSHRSEFSASASGPTRAPKSNSRACLRCACI